MDYLEKKMNPDYTMTGVEFKNAFKKISTNKNDDTTENFEQISEVQ